MPKSILLLIASLGLAVSLAFNIHLLVNQNRQNVVTEVVDGDTFQLASGKRVRLMGVDAPEFDRCGGKEAKNSLSEKIFNNQVELKEEVTEAYGRSLALVYVNDRLINELILKEGWARTDYRANSQRQTLTDAFHYARENKLGIFSPLCREETTTTDGNCLIKGNIDKATYKKFYHLPNCKQYNQIIIEKDIGEQYFCTESEAQKAGFTKSAGCTN